MFAIPVTFVNEDFVSGAASHASPIDVINYFCELRFEEEVSRLKAEALRLKEDKSAETQNKNTVLIMPRSEGLVYKLVRNQMLIPILPEVLGVLKYTPTV